MKNLKEKQRKTLEILLSLDILSDFYLAGGTSLLIKYDHRPSEDFDFFLFPEKSFKLDIYEKSLQKYHLENFKIIYKDNGTLLFTLNGVKVSLFHYPYSLLEKPGKIDGVFIASDKDIACMKASAISSKGLKKDFFDLWILIQIHNWELKDLINMLKTKYKEYNTSIFVKSLTYFEDAEKNKDFQIIETNWDKIKKFFRDFVKSLY
ncbi:nucleotidyl transferase AbiEii/AbiGii toxin family protein [Thermosipho ferrireducens]|uniref:Nucleotidyl transferase AbiEii/AbiGii toxin family protein n=1 Tax=Thermosipho ferrireducens TaxID=2571116 RepID=A0ABX7S7F3_9BACT|nr:nucleotidyl transferase AbiEii/AbiGii toxin family protein [Thermosipho ferrireducens]QTA38531.1 nucleotidyl transferase AbiEii/AbiGii toxin family protein [Thermosipho ferrireducens]